MNTEKTLEFLRALYTDDRISSIDDALLELERFNDENDDCIDKTVWPKITEWLAAHQDKKVFIKFCADLVKS